MVIPDSGMVKVFTKIQLKNDSTKKGNGYFTFEGQLDKADNKKPYKHGSQDNF